MCVFVCVLVCGVGLNKKGNEILCLLSRVPSVRTIDVTLEETVNYKLIINGIIKTYRQNAIVTKTKTIPFTYRQGTYYVELPSTLKAFATAYIDKECSQYVLLRMCSNRGA